MRREKGEEADGNARIKDIDSKRRKSAKAKNYQKRLNYAKTSYIIDEGCMLAFWRYRFDGHSIHC
jgi:hypothetical protein